jgi:hypothetical protein
VDDKHQLTNPCAGDLMLMRLLLVTKMMMMMILLTAVR